MRGFHSCSVPACLLPFHSFSFSSPSPSFLIPPLLNASPSLCSPLTYPFSSSCSTSSSLLFFLRDGCTYLIEWSYCMVGAKRQEVLANLRLPSLPGLTWSLYGSFSGLRSSLDCHSQRKESIVSIGIGGLFISLSFIGKSLWSVIRSSLSTLLCYTELILSSFSLLICFININNFINFINNFR